MKNVTVETVNVAVVDEAVGAFGKCVCGNLATHLCNAEIITEHALHTCNTPICDSCTHDYAVSGVLSDRKLHVRKDSSRFVPTALRASCDFCKAPHTIKCATIGSDACVTAQKEAASWKITISAKKLAHKFNSARR